MSAYNHFKDDTKAIEDGVWLEFPDFSIRIKKAGSDNKKLKAVTKKVMAPWRAFLASGENDLPDEVERKLSIEIFSKSVIVGWRGAKVVDENGDPILDADGHEQFDPFLGKDGKPLDFSETACQRVMKDLPGLFEIIVKESQNQALFRQARLKVDQGN